MALSEASTYQTIANALGTADNALQGQLATSSVGTAANKVREAREVIATESSSETGSEYSYLNTYESSMLTLEGTMKSALDAALSAAVTSANTYITASTGSSFRDWFNGTETERTLSHSSDNFRTLWRRVRSEELIVKHLTYTKSAGSWGSTAGKSIQLASLFEVRTGSGGAIGAAAIVLNIYMTLADGSSAAAPITVTIDAGTDEGTRISIGGTTKYYGISSVLVSGGTNGDVVEFWLR